MYYAICSFGAVTSATALSYDIFPEGEGHQAVAWKVNVFVYPLTLYSLEKY